MAPVTPKLEFVFSIKMLLGIRQKFGPLPQGSIRGFVSAAGGTVEGPRLNGRVVPNSGGDWHSTAAIIRWALMRAICWKLTTAPRFT